MAVINPDVKQPTKGVLIVKWILANGDTGLPFIDGQYPDKSVQIYGTFGAAGSVKIEGSDEAPQTIENPTPVAPTWFTLRDPRAGTNLLVFTAADGQEILENVTQIRPNVTAGDGTTSIKVVM